VIREGSRGNRVEEGSVRKNIDFQMIISFPEKEDREIPFELRGE
jgi:hypothetical protein